MTTNPHINTRIEFHILQSFPVTCLNRDDVGAPKTAVIGGSTRARVSSQCWKRQVRLAMRDISDFGFGVRTKRVKKIVEEACLKVLSEEGQELSEQLERNIDELSTAVSKNLDDKSSVDKKTGEFKTSTLVFLGRSDADVLAREMRKFDFSLAEANKKLVAIKADIKEAKKNKDNDLQDSLKTKESVLSKIVSIVGLLAEFDAAHDGLDIALFGRMVANAATMNVEAAASFSHAISTHRVSNEVEFFTALDDRPDEPGAAHIGSLEFNSATYYRYISLDLGQLAQTLGEDADLKPVIEAFTKALFVAVPSARQTTQSGASPWEFARVMVRKGQRLQVPFETAVKAEQGGYLQPSVEALKSYLDKKEKMTGSLFGKQAAYEWGEDENYSVDQLIADLQSHV